MRLLITPPWGKPFPKLIFAVFVWIGGTDFDEKVCFRVFLVSVVDDG
jgi:hypothetical protein